MNGTDDPHPVPGEQVDAEAAVETPLNRDDLDTLLARQFAEATAAAKPRGLTLRNLVRQHGAEIRGLVVASNGDWSKARAIVEQRLGRRVNIRSLRTYVADFFPQKELLRAIGPQTRPSLTDDPSATKPADAVTKPSARPDPRAGSIKSAGNPNPFAPRR